MRCNITMDAIKTACKSLESPVVLFIRATCSHTVHSEHDTKLLDAFWGQSPRRHSDAVLFQVLNESLDSLNVLRKLGIVCIVSLLDLLFFELE